MKVTGRKAKIVVLSGGSGIVCQAGGLLPAQTLRVSGLEHGLSAGLEPWRRPGAVHDPGKIVADLAVALALGGDCLADIAVLRSAPELSCPVASDPTVSRLVKTLADAGPRALRAWPSAISIRWTPSGGTSPTSSAGCCGATHSRMPDRGQLRPKLRPAIMEVGSRGRSDPPS